MTSFAPAGLSELESKDVAPYCTYLEAVLDSFDEAPYANLFLEDAEDDKHVLLCNVYEYITKDLLAITINKQASRLFETILERSTISQVMQACHQIIHSDHLELLCFNRFASYAIQKIIKIYGLVIALPHINTEISARCERHLSVVSGLVQKQLNDFVQNGFANHILRELLSTIHKSSIGSSTLVSKIYASVNSTWSDEPKLCGLLQTIFELDASTANTFIETCLQDTLKQWATTPSSSHLLEKLIATADMHHVKTIYRHIYKHNMTDLVQSNCAVYGIKILIDRLAIGHVKQLEHLFKALLKADLLVSLLRSNHFGMVLKFMDHLDKYTFKTQKRVTSALDNLTHNTDTSKQLYALISLGTDAPTLSGSLALQKILLHLSDHSMCDYIIQSQPDDMVGMMQHQTASFILDTLFVSDKVSKDIKKQVFDLCMSAGGASMATNKYACRVIESAWPHIDMQTKLKFMDALQPHRSALIKHPHGRKFAKFVNIDAHRANVHQWRKSEVTKIRNRAMFKSIVPSVPQAEPQHAFEAIPHVPIQAAPKSIIDAIRATKGKKRLSKDTKPNKRPKMHNSSFTVEVLD